MRLPLRLRLTLVYSAVMALLLATGVLVTYQQVGSALLRTTDSALRSQAALVQAGLGGQGTNFADQGVTRGVQTFSQVLDSTGHVVESSASVSGRPLVAPEQLRTVTGPIFVERRVPGIEGTARILVVPVSQKSSFVVVASSLSGRSEVLARLLLFLLVGGSVGLALASAAGWRLAMAALRPIERMRSEAAAISISEPNRRLSVPAANDEVARLGQTLNSMLDRLQRSFVRERRFVDDASHELRTPLAVLRGELELGLSGDASSAALKGALRNAIHETDRLTALADDLLVYSRENDGRLPLQRSKVRVDRLLESVRASFRKQVDAAGVKLDIHAPKVVVKIDENRLRQALDNLMTNAIRHTPPGGLITLTARVREAQLTLVLEDTGSGFDGEILDQAFEPFARGTQDRAESPTGAGLGLAIVRAVAETHGGHADAENRPGGGARVSISLPA